MTFSQTKIEKSPINIIRNEKVDATTDASEIKRIIRDHYEKLYTSKLDNLKKMGKFPETYHLPEINKSEQTYN